MNVDLAEPLKRALGEFVFNNIMLSAQLQAAQAKIAELEKPAPEAADPEA